MRCALLLLLGFWITPLAVGPSQRPAEPEGNVVKVRILDFNGAPVSSATVTVLRPWPGRVPYGVEMQCRDRMVEPRDFVNGVATLDQFPRGEFALLVKAERQTPTISAPFEVTGNKVPEITVKLMRGAVLEGVVENESGKAVVNAEVRTEATDDDWFGSRFGPIPPDLGPKASVRTGGDGRFRLPAIARGTQRVVALHPDYCSMRRDLEVTGDVTVAVPTFTLPRGSVVEGAVTWNGWGVAGISVCLFSSEPGLGGAEVDGRQHSAWSMHCATTNAMGNYRVGQRLPPGTWYMHARHPRIEDGHTLLLQVNETKCTLVIRAEDAKVTRSFQLPSER